MLAVISEAGTGDRERGDIIRLQRKHPGKGTWITILALNYRTFKYKKILKDNIYHPTLTVTQNNDRCECFQTLPQMGRLSVSNQPTSIKD